VSPSESEYQAALSRESTPMPSITWGEQAKIAGMDFEEYRQEIIKFGLCYQCKWAMSQVKVAAKGGGILYALKCSNPSCDSVPV